MSDIVAYSMTLADDSAGNHLDTFRGSSSDAVHAAMHIVITRGDFGKGDWFAAGTDRYEFRMPCVRTSAFEQFHSGEPDFSATKI